MKILNQALKFGDYPDITGSEIDFIADKSSELKQKKLSDETKNTFHRLIKETRFIAIDADHLISVSESTIQTNPVTGFTTFTSRESFDLPVSTPFKNQWIEICYKRKGEQVPSIVIQDSTVTFLGMLIHECSPGFYDVYSYISTKSGSTQNEFSVTRNIPSYTGFHSNPSLIQLFLCVWVKAINGGALGIEETNDFFLLPKENAKNKDKKKPHEIRRIVRIVTKKKKDKIEPMTQGGRIDFSHRWEVRGHWRRVAGIGKDRSGDYGVHGLTWVHNCIKGPESLPLITKTRWVPGIATA